MFQRETTLLLSQGLLPAELSQCTMSQWGYGCDEGQYLWHLRKYVGHLYVYNRYNMLVKDVNNMLVKDVNNMLVKDVNNELKDQANNTNNFNSLL